MNSLIPKRETMHIEFKSDISRLSDGDLVDAIVAFANTDGGELYLGVEDDGNVTGLHRLHRDPTQLAAMVANKTIPPISIWTEKINTEKPVLLIHVPKSRSIVASSTGKIQRRRLKADGTPENIPMYPFEITSRLSELSLLDFSAQPVPGASIDDFDPLEKERLRKMIMLYNGDRSLLELSDDEMIIALRLAITNNGECIPTYAGLLMLGKQDKLRDLMPTAESGFQQLRGTEVTVNETFYLPLLAAIERIIEFINARNPEQEIDMGIYRMSIPTFDRRAVREAVVNAFAHRDYTRLGRVLVQIDGDGITITNPGGFIEGVSYQNILSVDPQGRNPVLADALKRIGLAERTGRGVDRIFEGSLRYGRDIPDYTGSTAVSVSLFIPRGDPDLSMIHIIDGYQKNTGEPMQLNALMVINLLRIKQHMTYDQIKRELSLQESRLRAVLDHLIKSGTLETVQNGHGKVYSLNSRKYITNNDSHHQEISSKEKMERIMNMAITREYITRKEVIELLNVTPPQAYRLLQKLVKENRLRNIGTGKTTRYVVIS